jgi:Tfp pilus assembly protein PilO
MNLNKRQQWLALLAIAAVGFYVADNLVFTPLLNTWKDRSARVTKLKAQVSEGVILTDNKRAADWRDQWGRMQSNSLAWESIQTKPFAAAKPEAESQMLKQFEKWAQHGGVAVSSIRPQWKEAEEDYKTLECRADVAGSLQSIAKFLYQVETDPLGVKVDSLELTTRNADGSQLALVVQVSGLLLNPSKKTAR